MRLTLAIPIFNQLNDCKGALGTLRYMTSDDVEWLVIDNGSTEDVEGFIRGFLRPKRLNFIRNPKNIGLVKTYQQIYENCDTELLAITHNDVFIYEHLWDFRVRKYFETMSDLGIAGFFGAGGCGPDGQRIQDVPRAGMGAGMSSLLEAEAHGIRLPTPDFDNSFIPVAVLDGFMMIFRMEMLKKAGGFDQRYQYHHIYDRDASLESLRHGYKNIVVNVPCHHLSGLTANRGDYQNWVSEKTQTERGSDERSGDKWVHDKNTELFTQKWGSVLPLYIEKDFRFRDKTVEYVWGNFKGDDIKKLT